MGEAKKIETTAASLRSKMKPSAGAVNWRVPWPATACLSGARKNSRMGRTRGAPKMGITYTAANTRATVPRETSRRRRSSSRCWRKLMRPPSSSSRFSMVRRFRRLLRSGLVFRGRVFSRRREGGWRLHLLRLRGLGLGLFFHLLHHLAHGGGGDVLQGVHGLAQPADLLVELQFAVHFIRDRAELGPEFAQVAHQLGQASGAH